MTELLVKYAARADTVRTHLEDGSHGTMHWAAESGDLKLEWDSDDAAQVATVESQFDSLVGQGFRGYRMNPEDKSFDPINTFDATAVKIILAPAVAGGAEPDTEVAEVNPDDSLADDSLADDGLADADLSQDEESDTATTDREEAKAELENQAIEAMGALFGEFDYTKTNLENLVTAAMSDGGTDSES